jgi:hypothetical protein
VKLTIYYIERGHNFKNHTDSSVGITDALQKRRYLWDQVQLWSKRPLLSVIRFALHSTLSFFGGKYCTTISNSCSLNLFQHLFKGQIAENAARHTSDVNRLHGKVHTVLILLNENCIF